jgi:neutral ceramidase
MTAEDPELRAGTARRDITPDNGGAFFGYARPDKLAEGVAVRLFAHALVLDDGDRKVALVSADLGAPLVREAVLEHVRPLGFERDTLLFACTHTHAGPNDVGDWIAAQIGDAVAAADADRRPAVAGWGTSEVTDANRTRSVEAHLANHGQDHQHGTGTVDLDPEGPDHTRQTRLRMLRVETPDGDPLAAWTQFAVHPTAYTPHNTTFSADASGVAVRRFAEGFDEGEAPLTIYSSGTLGDLIPVYDDYNQHAVADSTGARIARGMDEAWADAAAGLSGSFPVDGRATTVVYEGQEVEPGKRVASEAKMGLPFFGGGQNGPSLFYDAGLEGMRLPGEDADPVHGRKIVLGDAGWSSDVEVQAVRVGDRLLLTYPGEPTTETGRRVRATASEVAPDGVADVAVLAITNGYHGYFTTPEEYDQQHYEGGHTVFGKYTSLLVERTHEELASELAAEPSERRDPAGERPDVPEPPAGRGSDDAALTDQPDDAVERMGVVEVGWRGGEGGQDRPVGEPFVVLERDTDGWTSVATDLEFGFVWTEAEGDYTARYDVPPDLPTGTYRLRIRGARYDLTTDPFAVRPSTGLRLRGVRAEPHGDGTRLAFEAQNPAPDPDRNLRTRPVRPTGGSLTFEHGGRMHGADWNPDGECWTAVVDGVSEGDSVTVPEGGLVDGYGNRSGAATELTVGEVAAVEWPSHVGSGGERPPAPDSFARRLRQVTEMIEEGYDMDRSL